VLPQQSEFFSSVTTTRVSERKEELLGIKDLVENVRIADVKRAYAPLGSFAAFFSSRVNSAG
jgi:hypothetical protein